MPVTFDLDPHAGLVHTHAKGRVTVGELIDHFEVLEADARLPRRVHLLLDLRETESLPGQEDVGEVMHEVDRLTTSRGLVGGACAIVAHREDLRSTAYVIATHAAAHFEHAQVFRELREAEDWLAAHR
jgi:hypothetical protein